MQQWNVEHRVSAVEQFFLETTIPLLLFNDFRRQFNVARDGAIPDRNTVLR